MNPAPLPAPDGALPLLIQSVAILVAVCVLAWVAIRFGLKRIHAPEGGGTGPVRILSRTTLEPRRGLYVVAVPGKTLLLGTSESGPTSVLAELNPAEVARALATPSGPRRSFLEVLRGPQAAAAEVRDFREAARPAHRGETAE